MKNTYISKTDLAQAYFPYVEAETARHQLMQIINSDAALMATLLKIGYKKTCRLLSPLCVEKIVESLGNPWK